MLNQGKDYTAVDSFELRAYSMTRTVITTPPETSAKGAGTDVTFFRSRLVANRILIQAINWVDIDNPAKWAHATNAFVDIIGADVAQYDLLQYASNKVMLIYQKTADDFCTVKIYTDGAGWATAYRNGVSNTPPLGLTGIPYYGHAELSLSGSAPSSWGFRSDNGDPNQAFYTLGDPVITKSFGFYSKTPMIMAYNARSELRIFYPLSYWAGGWSYSWLLKWGRAAASDIYFSQAGDTVFCRENGIISQGYNPFYMRTIYSFQELPNGKHNGIYYNHSGTKYTLTSTTLGQIDGFTQDWKKFKCSVPELTNTYTEPCTVFLRRNYTDGSYIDSNPMIVDKFYTDLFGYKFECSKILDAPAYSPLLHHIAESQPHLLYSHSIPYSPVAVKNQGTTIFNILERYKLVMSHDQAKLLIKTNASPTATLVYDLYKTDQLNSQAVLLTYTTDDLTIKSDLISGDQPTTTHNIGFITANLARTDLVKNYAFTFKRMTFERPPTYFQVGDVVTIDAQAGMIDDIQETFSAAKWRQNLTALVA